MRLALLSRRVEELLDQPELALTSDERSLEPGRLQRPSDPRQDPNGPPQGHGLRLALELVLPRVLVRDRRLARPPCGLADEHRPRRRGRLDPGRGVHEVARHHALPFGTDRDRGLAGQDAGAGAELRCTDLLTQDRHGGRQVQTRAHRELGVVLGGDRRSPDRHHRVADELLDVPAVAADDLPGRLEVAGEQVADLLRVPRLRERGEAHQVREQHGDQPPLGDRGRGRLIDRPGARRARARRARHEGGSALAAELHGWRVGCSTARARERQ